MSTQNPPTSAHDHQLDASLVKRCQDGEREAFGELVRRHQRPVFHVLWRYTRNDEDAKDLAQAAFVKAYSNLNQFRGDSSFRTWLYRIAVNLALNHARDRGKWQASEIAPETLSREGIAGETGGHGAAEALLAAELGRKLQAAVEELPPKQRLVVELRVHDELSFREVADIADCSEDAAKANFHHAIKRLRAMLGSAGADADKSA